MKTLVVYYSRKGYTEGIALEKAKEENADFLCLETIENTAGWYGFRNCLKFAVPKKGMTLFPYEKDVSNYDNVIICSPIWCGSVSSPMREFLNRERHNITRAEYILVHALPVNVNQVADEIDKILRLKRSKLTDIQCVFGNIVKEVPNSDD